MSFFSSLESVQDTATRSIIVPDQCSTVCEQVLTDPVGEVAHDRYAAKPNSLTPEQREAAIERAEDMRKKCQARYEQTHCFGFAGSADRYAMFRDELIKGRKA